MIIFSLLHQEFFLERGTKSANSLHGHLQVLHTLLLTQEAKQKSSIDYYGKEATCMGARNTSRYPQCHIALRLVSWWNEHIFQNVKVTSNKNVLTPFSGTVFHALSHGVIHFVQTVRFKNHLNRSFWLAVREFPPVRKWFLGLTLRTKRITPCERAWKTVPENNVGNCVHFCL